MAQHMEEHHWTQVARYTGGAFTRLRLGTALERHGVKPHLFESLEHVAPGG